MSFEVNKAHFRDLWLHLRHFQGALVGVGDAKNCLPRYCNGICSRSSELAIFA